MESRYGHFKAELLHNVIFDKVKMPKENNLNTARGITTGSEFTFPWGFKPLGFLNKTTELKNIKVLWHKHREKLHTEESTLNERGIAPLVFRYENETQDHPKN